MSTISEAYAAAVESFHAGDLQRAEGICRQINQVAPEYADAWYFRGLVNYSLGKPAIAIDYLRRALALSPDDEEAHNNLGAILCDLGQLDEAIASLQRAVELRPDYSDAQNNLGVAMKANEELDKAVECYRRAMQLTPDYGEAHLNLGGVLIAQGKLDEAADCYRQVMRIDPGNSIAAHMLAACTGAAVPDRASDQYVRNTFDKFAGRFNQALQRLNYQAPRLVTEALAREIPEPSRALDILDAGCGTGLCGPLLRPYANHLVGMDLSPGMLRQAARTDVYDALVEAELVGFQKTVTVPSIPKRKKGMVLLS